MKWFIDGDRKTMFFQSYVKGKRKKFHMAEMIIEQGMLLKSNEEIGEATIQYLRIILLRSTMWKTIRCWNIFLHALP